MVTAEQKIPALFRVPYEFFSVFKIFIYLFHELLRNAYRCSTKHCFRWGRVLFGFMCRSVPKL